MVEISIHAPLAGSDVAIEASSDAGFTFQSTLPLRGATDIELEFIEDEDISIHAPLAGSDTMSGLPTTTSLGFQSTLPLRGATSYFGHPCIAQSISIHAPLAGSDDLKPQGVDKPRNFNPRSPCGERRFLVGK